MGPEDQIIVPVEMGVLCNTARLNCSFEGKVNKSICESWCWITVTMRLKNKRYVCQNIC